MNIISHDMSGTLVAEMQSGGIVIRSARDAADVIRQLLERGIRKLILHERNLCPEMWQISNGMAGAVLREFANSTVDVAFVGAFDLRKSKGLQEFITNNTCDQAFFAETLDLAKARLANL
jgi:hypothetical protein